MSANLAGFPPRYLRTPEASRFVGLSIRTLEKHRIYGTGPRYSKLGGRVVYRLEDLQAWVESGAKASTSDPGASAVLPAKRHPAAAQPQPVPDAPLSLPRCHRATAHDPSANSLSCSAPCPAIWRPATRRT